MKELLASFFLALVAGSIINGYMQSTTPVDKARPTSPQEAPSKPLVKDTSDEGFTADVLDSSIPVLVDFGATWCRPCRSMEPVLNQVASDYKDRLKVVKVDVDANDELTNQFRITSLPTYIVFKNGHPVDSFSGATTKEVLESELSKYIQ